MGLILKGSGVFFLPRPRTCAGCIWVSVLTAGQETHDRLRGAGAYQKTLKTIEWIAENFGKDIILEFKFTINRLNYAELGDVYRLAQAF